MSDKATRFDPRWKEEENGIRQWMQEADDGLYVSYEDYYNLSERGRVLEAENEKLKQRVGALVWG